MSSVEDKPKIDWKKLWQLCSGINYETPNENVKDELLNISQELLEGILQFKRCTSSPADLENFLKKRGQMKLFPFTNKLQQLLDLESTQCWGILRSYLVSEYRGSANSLTNFISTEANMMKLLNDIWGYYSLERMISLKMTKNLLEFFKSTNHVYRNEYNFVINKITLKRMRQSYIDQLESLIKEKPPARLAGGEFFDYHAKLTSWAERKLREINEILHILILIVHHDGVEPNEIKTLLDCFITHAFGKQQLYLDSSNEFHEELMNRVTFSEIMLFLRCVDLYECDMEPTWLNNIKQLLEKTIINLHHNPEHGPLLLSWMLLNFHSKTLTEDYDASNRYRQFGSKAVQLNVFEYLHRILSHQMFRDNSAVSRVARKTVYNQLSFLCDLFDGDGSVSQHPYIYELLSEILSWPSTASDFCKNEEGGVRSLYNTALENFPVEFIPLSIIAHALTSAGKSQSSYIRNQLEHLPIYTEKYDGSKINLRPSIDCEDEFILAHEYFPFNRIDYKLERNTTAIVIDKKNGTMIHFRQEVNYFNVLQNEINLLLAEAVQYTEIDQNRLKRVNAGIKYLSAAIQKIESPVEISAEMVHPTEMVIDLLNKLKILQTPAIELLANCLNVCAALLPLFESEIFMRVINLNILPNMTNELMDFRKYSEGACFDSSLVGFYLVNFEKNWGKFEFLLAYLNFLSNYTKLRKNNLFAMEIPGLIFLLREIFPHIHSWRFKMQLEKNRIYTFVMQYFFDILQLTKDQIKEYENRQILRDICVYSLLNLDNGWVLLKFVSIGNPFLQAFMENEVNWITSSTVGLNLLVQRSITILMQLLRLKTTIMESSILSPLESVIYTQPKQRDTLRIIPVVTSYMNNIFNRSLPILSCRLLRRFAIEFKMSLLACLDMESDQIRLTFLQSLPDELESDNLKMAVLDFVEACIQKQPGLTEAFFKLNYEKEKRFLVKEKKTKSIGDSILTYMAEYLEAILNNPKTVASPLLSRIMSLFHALWKNSMQTLVKDLMEKPTFWPSLCSPLFGTINEDVKAYSQIFNILGIEVFCLNDRNKINDELKKTIEKFLSPGHFERWVRSIFDLPKVTIEDYIEEETPEWLCRLQSFKDFIVILLRKNVSEIEFPEQSQKLLATECLNNLVERAEYIDDLRPFIILSEFYLIILIGCKKKFTNSREEDNQMLKHIVNLLNCISVSYDDIHTRARESCLSIAIKLVDLLANEIVKDSGVAIGFLQPMVSIICTELDNLEKCVKCEISGTTVQPLNVNSLILSLNLLKRTAIVFHKDGPERWDQPFISGKIFNRLLNCANLILQLSSKNKITVEVLDVLVVFAKGSCSNEFLHCFVGDYLWLKLLPPKELLQAPYVIQTVKDNTWITQNWWPIYSRGIELVTILLQKHKHHILKDVLIFVGVHEEYLMDSLLLAKQSLEPNAMILIKNTVELIAELVAYEKEWRLDHSQSMFNLMRCVQMLLEHSISLLYRPKILKRLVSNTESTDDLTTAMNDLIQIFMLCTKSLLSFSPTLLELIAEPEFLACKWEPIIEIQFGAPKLDAGNDPQLTFGTVLSAVGIFTKVLNLKNSSFPEKKLNVLPSVIHSTSPDTISLLSSFQESSILRSTTQKRSASSGTTSGPRTPLLKSLSITSGTSIVSSTTAPSNEILASLDSHLCLKSLEHILTLLASQSLLALKNVNLSSREKQLIRREISTELMIYHEFVRKRVLSEFNKSMWNRKKHGIEMMTDTVYSEAMNIKSTVSNKLGHKKSMHDNVVRRLHLQHQTSSPHTSRRPFDMSHIYSPITGSSQKKSDLNIPDKSSTPNLNKPSSIPEGGRISKRVSLLDDYSKKRMFHEEQEEEITYFEPEEPNFSALSYIQLVEGDYLHFLSNLFSVICQSE